MNKRRWIGGGAVGAAVAGGLMLGLGLGGSAVPTHAQTKPMWQYSVKFTCAPEVGAAEIAGTDAPFVPAMYRTAINIHNPQRTKVAFMKHAVSARAEEQPRGKISQRRTDVLQPDEALDVDCLTVQSLFGGTQPVGDGFVVIDSAQQLDVVAVYTASTGAGTSVAGAPAQGGADVEVEYIQPRRVTSAGAGPIGADSAQPGD